MDQSDSQAEHLLDIALALAEEAGSWESVRLHAVAERAGLTLDQVRSAVREKEDLVERWFDRADRAMLEAASAPEFASLDTVSRLHRLVMAWLEPLSVHRRVTREMIVNKLEPGHLHVQIPGLLRVSRTVQWVREAARRESTFACRAIEEIALTSIFLAVFARWMGDSSTESVDSSRLLLTLLNRARDVRRLFPVRRAVAPRGGVV